jgi:hypothetical protein
MKTNSIPPSSITVEPMAKKAFDQKNNEKEVSIPWWWIKNDKGRKSVSVTFATVAFLVTTVVYVAAAIESVGSVSFRPFDVGACVAYFLPALSLYFGRRLTDTKYSSKNDVQVEK